MPDRQATLDDLLGMLAWNLVFGHVADESALNQRARELIAEGARLPARMKHDNEKEVL